MDLSVWITYFIATIILSVTPGPGVFSSLSSGLNHGFRMGVWNGVGMQAANFILICIVSLGLGAILLASETLFTAVKWIGVVYLIYLGIVTWRSPPKTFHAPQFWGKQGLNCRLTSSTYPSANHFYDVK